MTGAFYIVILCLTLGRLSDGDKVNIVGNCSRTVRPEPLEVWGIQRDETLNCVLLPTSSCQDVALPPQVSDGPFMGQPHSLDVGGTLVPDPSGNFSPQLILEWTPPQSAAGFEHLRGFLVEIRRLTGGEIAGSPPFVCRIFDFSASNFTSKDYKLKFRKRFIGFPGGTDILYRLDLVTLPRGSGSLGLHRYYRLPAVQARHPDGTPKASADWVASISYNFDNLTGPADLTFRFTPAPAVYQFMEYEIQLVSDADNRNAYRTCIISTQISYNCDGRMYSAPSANATGIEHTFYGIPGGLYSIQIQPVDPNWQNDNCLCYQLPTSNSKSCQRCMTTRTPNFTIAGGQPVSTTQAPSSSPSSSSSSSSIPASSGTLSSEGTPINPIAQEVTEEPNNTMKFVGAAVGVVLGIFLVLLLVFFLWKQRTSLPRFTLPLNAKKQASTIDQGQGRYTHYDGPPVLQEKSVVLLFEGDHDDHRNAVAKLASFLQRVGRCRVLYAPWYGHEIQRVGEWEWAFKHINTADFTIVINSEAAFKLNDSRNDPSSYKIFNKTIGDEMFLPALSHLRAKAQEPNFFAKTILIYFEYTDSKFVLTDMNPGVSYKVPKHMLELLCHIHGVMGQDGDPRRKDIEAMVDLNKSAEGRELMLAIRKSSVYNKQHPNWFDVRFPRQDSGTYSYSSAENQDDDSEHLDSVSMNEDHRQVPLQNDVDDQRSAYTTVTYDTNFANGVHSGPETFHQQLQDYRTNSNFPENSIYFFPPDSHHCFCPPESDAGTMRTTDVELALAQINSASDDAGPMPYVLNPVQRQHSDEDNASK